MNGLDGIKSVVALQFLLCVAGLFQGIHAGRFLLSISLGSTICHIFGVKGAQEAKYYLFSKTFLKYLLNH